MRWSYKTILYELKKEGLLGSAFLDESEIEQSLNEFGTTGWELVSMLETRDGIIAVFKQPLARAAVQSLREETEELKDGRESQPKSPVPRIKEPVIRTLVEPEEEAEPVTGIGSIRIE
jgi:hypothetical protein